MWGPHGWRGRRRQQQAAAGAAAPAGEEEGRRLVAGAAGAPLRAAAAGLAAQLRRGGAGLGLRAEAEQLAAGEEAADELVGEGVVAGTTAEDDTSWLARTSCCVSLPPVLVCSSFSVAATAKPFLSSLHCYHAIWASVQATNGDSGRNLLYLWPAESESTGLICGQSKHVGNMRHAPGMNSIGSES